MHPMNFLRKATVNPLDGQPQIVFYPQPDFLNKLLIPATGRNTSKKQQTFKKTLAFLVPNFYQQAVVGTLTTPCPHFCDSNTFAF